MTGQLIGVVGPSGVGKDTLMEAIAASRPEFDLVRRVITRSPEAGGEDYDPVTVAEFEDMRRAGAFCLHWNAHGLRYGIPNSAPDRVAAGAHLLVNLSRSVLLDVAGVFPRFSVLNVTAKPETLAARLSARGRETEDEIAQRLARLVEPLPESLNIVTISNDGTIEEAVAAAIDALAPAGVS